MLESKQALPWKVSDAPQDFTDRMVNLLVGLEMPIDAIEGKWKTSQNRPRTDQMGVVAGLKARGDGQSLAMAELIELSSDPIDGGSD